jgi:uncharacterized protein (TIGR00661 family)
MRILFGVFDWGLGHATRDMPLIQELLREGHRVDIISTGRALNFLKMHFVDKCRYFDVRSVYPPYTRTKFFATKFFLSIPRLLFDLVMARRISRKIIKNGNYDKLISDCRYDVYDRKNNSFLINHQLTFMSPVCKKAVAYCNYLLMKPFGSIIVPDFESRPLTGKLSVNRRYKGKVAYIGHISNLKKSCAKQSIDYFISISGPEPQRAQLEQLIMKQVSCLKGKIVVACGNPDKKYFRQMENRIRVFSFLDQKRQAKYMNSAKFVISRSGYTTAMELAELGKKKVLLIPTPGQPEQEYLAYLCQKAGFFHRARQHKIDIVKEIDAAKKYRGYNPPWKAEESVNRFMQVIKLENR